MAQRVSGETIILIERLAPQTITEDLNLSYRAQLAGWKFVYLDEVDTPAELPSDMNAFKTQQHRWAKGSIQVAQKLLSQIVKSSIPARIKLESAFHLCNNFAYVLLATMAVLMPLSIRIRAEHQGTTFGSLTCLYSQARHFQCSISILSVRNISRMEL